jgi:hypothetical protein
MDLILISKRKPLSPAALYRLAGVDQQQGTPSRAGFYNDHHATEKNRAAFVTEPPDSLFFDHLCFDQKMFLSQLYFSTSLTQAVFPSFMPHFVL